MENQETNHTHHLESSVTPFKFQSILIIFSISLFGGLLPLKVTTSRRLISIGNALSGGVFLSAGVLHMLMEGIEGFINLELDPELAMLLFIAGILLPLFFENVADFGENHKDIFVSFEDKKGNFSVYLLMIMLSVHSLVEGFALGVQDDMEDTSTILIAIVSHKFFAAFALGVSLVKKVDGISVRKIVQLVCLFSITTPIGIGSGLLLTSAVGGKVESLLAESLKPFAAGTFVYVALVEVILQEFGHSHGHNHGHTHEHSHNHDDENQGPSEADEIKNSKDKYIKFLAIVLGVAIQTVLARSFAHTHSHGDDHTD